MMPSAPPHPYPSGFMPCPSPFPMGYPMPPYCYPYQMHPQMAAEGMPGVSGYSAPPYVRPPLNPPPKVPRLLAVLMHRWRDGVLS